MRHVSVKLPGRIFPQWRYGDLLITGRVLALVIWCVMFMMVQESWGQCNIDPDADFNCSGTFCFGGDCVKNTATKTCECGGVGFCGKDTIAECRDTGCAALNGTCTGAACNCIIPPTPIELVSFTAEVDTDGSVTLRWETGSENDNAGFNLYRVAGDGTFDTMINDTLIPAQGDVSSGASYSLIDRPGSGTFFYMLEDISINGVSKSHAPISASIPQKIRRRGKPQE